MKNNNNPQGLKPLSLSELYLRGRISYGEALRLHKYNLPAPHSAQPSLSERYIDGDVSYNELGAELRRQREFR